MVVLLASVAVAVGMLGSEKDGDGGSPSATTTAVELKPLDDEPLERVGSTEVDDAPLGVGEGLDEYRITYRVGQRGTASMTTEVLTVVRPFTSELETRDASDTVVAVQQWAFGRVMNSTGAEDLRVFAVGPNVGGYDFHPRISVDEAAARGLLEVRELREVAGRRCRVHRVATAVSDGVLVPLGDTSEEHADLCIDADGLLLEEWWVLDGGAIRQRVATAVRTSVPAGFGADWSELPTSQPVGLGGGSVARLVPGSAPPGPFFESSSVPDGLVHLGRFIVIPPQAIEVEGADPGATIASTADVWRRGLDVLVLDQGGTSGGRDLYEPDPDNRSVEIPGLGTAEVVLGLATNEIRVPRGVGTYVRVIGTLSSDELLAFARTLVETVGNEIVIDDGPLLP